MLRKAAARKTASTASSTVGGSGRQGGKGNGLPKPDQCNRAGGRSRPHGRQRFRVGRLEISRLQWPVALVQRRPASVLRAQPEGSAYAGVPGDLRRDQIRR